MQFNLENKWNSNRPCDDEDDEVLMQASSNFDSHFRRDNLRQNVPGVPKASADQNLDIGACLPKLS